MSYKDTPFEADTKVVNPFGEHVWLKQKHQSNNESYLTDCCLVGAECDHHAKLANSQRAQGEE